MSSSRWDDAQWFKATGSQDVGCVEVAFSGGLTGVRDTKDGGTGPVLEFDPVEWAAFLDGAKRGEFDLPRR